MRITDAGDVGIGTASPSHKLSIDSGSKTNGSVYLTNTAGGGVINFYDENQNEKSSVKYQQQPT